MVRYRHTLRINRLIPDGGGGVATYYLCTIYISNLNHESAGMKAYLVQTFKYTVLSAEPSNKAISAKMDF